MDRETNIAFIPKAPLTTSDMKRRPASIFFVITLIIFIASVGATTGLFLYKNTLQKSLREKNAEIISLRSDYEASAADQDIVHQAEELGLQLNTVKGILDKHISLIPLFDFLSEHTLKDVQFNSFAFDRDAKDGPTVVLGGLATSYMSVALEREELKRCTVAFQKKNTARACGTPDDPFMISSFTISTPTISTTGEVTFNLTLIINKDALLYRRLVAASTKVETTTALNTEATTTPEGGLLLRTQ